MIQYRELPMGWIRKKWKSLMRRLRGEYYYTAGDNVIYDEDRGGIRHQYSFSPVDSIRAEHLRVNSLGTESVIRYHLTNYDEDAVNTWLFIVEDTIHELTHWAMEDEKNSATHRDDGEHSMRWKKTIYPLISYCHDNLEVEMDG